MKEAVPPVAVDEARDGRAPGTALYDAPGRLLNWMHTAKGGMSVDIVLVAFGPHPFRDLNCGKENGQRLRVSVTRHDDVDGEEEVYAGESLLLDWGDTARSGKMVRLMLDDGPDGATGRHPFFGLPFGKVTGEPLSFKAVAIADDESEIPAGKLKRREPFQTLSPVRQCHILCRDGRFRGFLRENAERFLKDAAKREAVLSLADTPEAFGAAMTRAVLGVPTRAVMGHETEQGDRARRIWRRLLEVYDEETWGVIRR